MENKYFPKTAIGKRAISAIGQKVLNLNTSENFVDEGINTGRKKALTSGSQTSSHVHSSCCITKADHGTVTQVPIVFK